MSIEIKGLYAYTLPLSYCITTCRYMNVTSLRAKWLYNKRLVMERGYIFLIELNLCHEACTRFGRGLVPG